MPSVVVTIACVSPRVNSAEPWVRGQEADADLDRAHGLGVAAVDAAAFLEDRAADDVGLDALDQLAGDELLLRVAFGERLGGLGARGGERDLALLLVGQLVGGLDIVADRGP